MPLAKYSHQMRPSCGRRIRDTGQGLNGQRTPDKAFKKTGAAVAPAKHLIVEQ